MDYRDLKFWFIQTLNVDNKIIYNFCWWYINYKKRVKLIVREKLKKKFKAKDLGESNNFRNKKKKTMKINKKKQISNILKKINIETCNKFFL